MVQKETKDRLNVYLPLRLKRRLKELAHDKEMTMNDLVVTAISDMVDRMDADQSAHDLVLERMSQVLNSQMVIVTAVNTLSGKIDNIDDKLDE